MKCPYPITVKNPLLGYIEVPCGKCLICQRNLVHDWSMRMRYESLDSKCVFFITLTYDDDHLPINEQGFVTLVKSDLQKFFKRLRKSIKVRYFAVGEYGSKFGRPHFHIILFTKFKIDWYDMRNLIAKCWHSRIDVQTAKDAERLSSYCSKYCFKNDNRVDDSQVKPYRTCSKKPILGYLYLQKFGSLHLSDTRFRFLSAESSLYKPSRLPLAFQRYLYKNESNGVKLTRNLFKLKNQNDYEITNYIKVDESRLRDDNFSIKSHLQSRRARYEQIERERENERLSNKDINL